MKTFSGFAAPSILQRVAPLLAKLLALCSVVGAIALQLSPIGIVLGVIGLVGAAVLGLWGAHYQNGRIVSVEITDISLNFKDGARHTFGSNPLLALRGVKHDFADRTDITAIQVPIDSGKTRTLLFMDLVTDDSYGEGPWPRAGIKFDPDQNGLLQLLQERLPSNQSKRPRYSINLAGPIGEDWQFDELIVEGDSLTFVKGGQSRAVVALSSTLVQPYTFKPTDDLYPQFALRLTLPTNGIVVELGAYAAWDHSLPGGLPRGDGPYYTVGAAQLHRLNALIQQ